jgi:hypothetical protein
LTEPKSRRAEVEDADFVAASACTQQNVGGLEVAVNHAVAVRMMQCKGELARDADHARWSHGSFACQDRAEPLAFDELHRHELSAARRLAELTRIDDIGVVQ